MRIGVLLCAKGINRDAAQFLVLAMNRQQGIFEFEFLPFDAADAFLSPLCRAESVDRDAIRKGAQGFADRYSQRLGQLNVGYGLTEPPPQHFVLVSLARFTNNYYSMRQGAVSVLALGDWDRHMSPPTLFEFIMVLVLRDSVAAVSPELRGSVHLGTKGCLCDFTASLSDVRFKVLTGFVCSSCRERLERDGLPYAADALARVMAMDWLGTSDDAASPAGIARKLGHDLFVVSGPKATPWERLKLAGRRVGADLALKVVGGLVVAAALLVLGLK